MSNSIYTKIKSEGTDLFNRILNANDANSKDLLIGIFKGWLDTVAETIGSLIEGYSIEDKQPCIGDIIIVALETFVGGDYNYYICYVDKPNEKEQKVIEEEGEVLLIFVEAILSHLKT